MHQVGFKSKNKTKKCFPITILFLTGFDKEKCQVFWEDKNKKKTLINVKKINKNKTTNN